MSTLPLKYLVCRNVDITNIWLTIRQGLVLLIAVKSRLRQPFFYVVNVNIDTFSAPEASELSQIGFGLHAQGLGAAALKRDGPLPHDKSNHNREHE